MSYPVSDYDFFGRKDVAEHILGKTEQTFSKYRKSGLLFEPYTTRYGRSNGRKYYNLADAMKMSIILYGSIKMERIYNLLGFEEGENMSPISMRRRKQMIAHSLNRVKDDIMNHSTDPVDLTPYLKPEEQQQNG